MKRFALFATTVLAAGLASLSSGCGGPLDAGDGLGASSEDAKVYTYDGVAFSSAQLKVAMEVLNLATKEQLLEKAKLASTQASLTVAGRTWHSMKSFSTTSGIGPATMQHLKDYVTSGAWLPLTKDNLRGGAAGYLPDWFRTVEVKDPTWQSKVGMSYSQAVSAGLLDDIRALGTSAAVVDDGSRFLVVGRVLGYHTEVRVGYDGDVENVLVELP
jgi:hypothetical protein